MIIPAKERNTIIQGLLPLLAESFQTTERVVRVKGQKLLDQGITETVNGKLVYPNTDYYVPQSTKVKINHERELRNVISKARDYQGMQDDLARYLVKYGISKQVITDSINNKNTPTK